MLTLKCLASGSKGNCYLLSSERETLILDCGISMREIKRGLWYDLKRVVGVCVTHGHKDHAASAAELRRMWTSVWMPYDEKELLNMKQFGGFRVQCFPLPHNGTPNYGFFIRAEGQTILYMTDFEYCQYSFEKQKVNHILIECNYSKELVDRNLPQYEHKIKGHCGLDYCKRFIQCNKTDDLRTVLLLHMGRDTCDPEECVGEIKKIAPAAHVDAARAGLTVDLDEFPF